MYYICTYIILHKAKFSYGSTQRNETSDTTMTLWFVRMKFLFDLALHYKVSGICIKYLQRYING